MQPDHKRTSPYSSLSFIQSYSFFQGHMVSADHTLDPKYWPDLSALPYTLLQISSDDLKQRVSFQKLIWIGAWMGQWEEVPRILFFLPSFSFLHYTRLLLFSSLFMRGWEGAVGDARRDWMFVWNISDMLLWCTVVIYLHHLLRGKLKRSPWCPGNPISQVLQYGFLRPWLSSIFLFTQSGIYILQKQFAWF